MLTETTNILGAAGIGKRPRKPAAAPKAKAPARVKETKTTPEKAPRAPRGQKRDQAKFAAIAKAATKPQRNSPAAEASPAAPAVRKPTRKHQEAIDAAVRGIMPQAPDFSAATHAPWRKKLAAVVAMAAAGDIAGLEAIAIEPKSSSRVAICRYRDLSVIALKAKASVDETI